ncbi:MAG: hypothetical protein H6Q64_548 [Firmicutes bacterium]|nr:hypothetical protein [Bacillota bacterium]
MKKFLIYILIFIILCYLFDTGMNLSIAKQIDNRSPYCLSFASIGANLLESRLDSWAKIKTAESFNELDNELIGILNLLDLPVKKSAMNYSQEQGKLLINYHTVKDHTDYHINLQTENHATYFILTAISCQGDLSLRNNAKLLKQQYKGKSYFQYKGIINARPGLDGLQKILHVICKCLYAQEKDFYQSQDMISMATFSPLLQEEFDQVELAGEIFNLQMAIHNDSNKNQSYVYLGIPLLLNDY